MNMPEHDGSTLASQPPFPLSLEPRSISAWAVLYRERGEPAKSRVYIERFSDDNVTGCTFVSGPIVAASPGESRCNKGARERIGDDTPVRLEITSLGDDKSCLRWPRARGIFNACFRASLRIIAGLLSHEGKCRSPISMKFGINPVFSKKYWVVNNFVVFVDKTNNNCIVFVAISQVVC